MTQVAADITGLPFTCHVSLRGLRFSERALQRRLTDHGDSRFRRLPAATEWKLRVLQLATGGRCIALTWPDPSTLRMEERRSRASVTGSSVALAELLPGSMLPISMRVRFSSRATQAIQERLAFQSFGSPIFAK